MFDVRVALIIAGSVVTGCANHDGLYRPGCIAYAGNTVELQGDRFVLDRFTDAVRVDDSGNVIDPYPEYPKRGRYSLNGKTLSMTTESGERLDNMHLLQNDGVFVLLTDSEHDAWKNAGSLPDCVLTRNAD